MYWKQNDYLIKLLGWAIACLETYWNFSVFPHFKTYDLPRCYPTLAVVLFLFIFYFTTVCCFHFFIQYFYGCILVFILTTITKHFIVVLLFLDHTENITDCSLCISIVLLFS